MTKHVPVATVEPIVQSMPFPTTLPFPLAPAETTVTAGEENVAVTPRAPSITIEHGSLVQAPLHAPLLTNPLVVAFASFATVVTQ